MAAAAEVTQMYDELWMVHISQMDDEWTGLCGAASDDIMLVDAPARVPSKHKLCAECSQILDSGDG